jgi:hypothetical protein
MDGDINVCLLARLGEQYVVLYDDEHRSEALRQLGNWASNYALSFTWLDAARMSKSIRESNDGAMSPVMLNRLRNPQGG